MKKSIFASIAIACMAASSMVQAETKMESVELMKSEMKECVMNTPKQEGAEYGNCTKGKADFVAKVSMKEKVKECAKMSKSQEGVGYATCIKKAAELKKVM